MVAGATARMQGSCKLTGDDARVTRLRLLWATLRRLEVRAERADRDLTFAETLGHTLLKTLERQR